MNWVGSASRRCLPLAQWRLGLHQSAQGADVVGPADAGGADQDVVLELQRKVAVAGFVDQFDALAALLTGTPCHWPKDVEIRPSVSSTLIARLPPLVAVPPAMLCAATRAWSAALGWIALSSADRCGSRGLR
jgi:hypothetical protein